LQQGYIYDKSAEQEKIFPGKEKKKNQKYFLFSPQGERGDVLHKF